jgi:hypothetical protein
VKIFWACPVYKEPHPLYVHFMNAARRHFGDRLEVRHYPGDSDLSRARAALYAAYRELGGPGAFTHFLQTDDDQSFWPEHLEELAALGYPLAGFPVAYKVDPPHPAAGQTTVRALAGEQVAPDGTLRVKYLGGLILWRADVLAAMEAAHPELEYDTNPPGGETQVTYDFWLPRVVAREHLSEDYAAQDHAERLGYEIRATTRYCAPHWVGEREVDWTDPDAVEKARLTWKGYVPAGYQSPGVPGVRMAARVPV